MATDFILSSFGKTDVGLVRKHNEDHYLICDKCCVYAVADGLGGLPKGSLASELAIKELENILKEGLYSTLEALPFDTIFARINDAIHQVGHTVDEHVGIGTTLTVAQCVGDKLYVGHVGDTEALVYRGEACFKLTKDHTMAQQILDGLKPGAAMPKIPPYFYHTLTRCLGPHATILTDMASFDLRKDDRILLISDGVSKVINEDELKKVSLKASEPKALCEQIIKIANTNGGPDNITAIAVFVH